jgi:hypothetical protein
VRIDTDAKRPVDTLLFAVETDGLGYREDMRLVEGTVERAAAMPGGPEGHALRGHGWVRMPRVIGRQEIGDVDETRRIGDFTR